MACLNVVFSRVGGWSRTAEKHLSGTIHVGDELIQVADSNVESVSQVHLVLQNVPTSGAPVSFASIITIVPKYLKIDGVK